MSEEIRYQPLCYHASPEYSRSFWGRNIYIYQGSGSLTLTTEGLSFHGKRLNFDIPLAAIRGFSLSEFSRSSKPFGLLSLVLRYEVGGKEYTTHLVPCRSPFAPTWESSKIVTSWLDLLRSQKGLADRVDFPLLADAPRSSAPFLIPVVAGFGFVAFIFLIFSLVVN